MDALKSISGLLSANDPICGSLALQFVKIDDIGFEL